MTKKERIEALRKRLDDALRNIPGHIINGSVQLAVEYKDWAAKARRVLANRGARESDLQRELATYGWFLLGKQGHHTLDGGSEQDQEVDGEDQVEDDPPD